MTHYYGRNEVNVGRTPVNVGINPQNPVGYLETQKKPAKPRI